MRSVERLEQQKKVRRQIKNRPEPDMETEEEMEHPRFVPMNRRKSIFDENPNERFGGINTLPSVFESQTAIKTD